MSDTEIINLPPADEAALQAVIAGAWSSEDARAEQFARYEEAHAQGLIDKLCEYTRLHGAQEGRVLRWPVAHDGVALEAKYNLDTGALIVCRETECVLDDGAGRELVFRTGKNGRWIQALLLEHEALVRQAKQAQRLQRRRKQQEAADERGRDI